MLLLRRLLCSTSYMPFFRSMPSSFVLRNSCCGAARLRVAWEPGVRQWTVDIFFDEISLLTLKTLIPHVHIQPRPICFTIPNFDDSSGIAIRAIFFCCTSLDSVGPLVPTSHPN